MTVPEIREIVIQGICEIQTLSGRPEHIITDNTVPLQDLPDFDSVNAEEVTARILATLQIDLGSREHLFFEGNKLKTVGDVVANICELTGVEGA